MRYNEGTIARREMAGPEKIFVRVNADFDVTGYMIPRSITWNDGRIFHIEEVKDFRTAAAVGACFAGDCYTVVVHGQERFLFHDKPDPRHGSNSGRWFVQGQ